MPAFIVTHDTRDPIVTRGGTRCRFVTDGQDRALDQARDAAGRKDISIEGANVLRHCLAAGAIEEIRLHLIPVVVCIAHGR